jgi:hypothetical protein
MSDPVALTAEDVQEAQTPAWAREETPEAFRPFLGKFGLPDSWRNRPGPLGKKVLGIDRWQANCFIVCRPETEAFLYGFYTPTQVRYKPGLLPAFERLAGAEASREKTARDKATVFVTRTLPALFPHPTVPPVGPFCRTDRALDDEALLASGVGFCNEQARVFIRLCQACNIPARLVFLFYSDNATGHTTAEFWTGSNWALVDVSWYTVFPGRDGALMSALECHGRSVNRGLMADAYYTRMAQILELDDEALAGRSVPAVTADRPAALNRRAAELRAYVRERFNKEYLAGHLDRFGILNYPLPAWGGGMAGA